MINKIKKLYSGYTIFVKKNKFIYDINNNIIEEKDVKKEQKYIIVEKNSYEVHRKS